jgi:hypothetical protein
MTTPRNRNQAQHRVSEGFCKRLASGDTVGFQGVPPGLGSRRRSRPLNPRRDQRPRARRWREADLNRRHNDLHRRGDGLGKS